MVRKQNGTGLILCNLDYFAAYLVAAIIMRRVESLANIIDIGRADRH